MCFRVNENDLFIFDFELYFTFHRLSATIQHKHKLPTALAFTKLLLIEQRNTFY